MDDFCSSQLKTRHATITSTSKSQWLPRPSFISHCRAMGWPSDGGHFSHMEMMSKRVPHDPSWERAFGVLYSGSYCFHSCFSMSIVTPTLRQVGTRALAVYVRNGAGTEQVVVLSIAVLACLRASLHCLSKVWIYEWVELELCDYNLISLLQWEEESGPTM